MFKSNGGFTLVELVVVIAILGILATFAAPQFTKYITAAENAKADYQTAADDLEEAVTEYDEYLDFTARSAG